jgi:hypothetical protein
MDFYKCEEKKPPSNRAQMADGGTKKRKHRDGGHHAHPTDLFMQTRCQKEAPTETTSGGDKKEQAGHVQPTDALPVAHPLPQRKILLQ